MIELHIIVVYKQPRFSTFIKQKQDLQIEIEMLLYRSPRKYQKPKEERTTISFRSEEEYEAAAARSMNPKAKQNFSMVEERKELQVRRSGLSSVLINRELAK